MGAVLKVKLCGLSQRGDRLELVRDWNDCPAVDALVDTGAHASVITRALAERAGAKIMAGLRTFRGRACAGALMALAMEGCDRSNHVVVVDDDLFADLAEAEPLGGMILGRDYLSDNRVIDEVRENAVVRLKITRAEATALRGFARQLTTISNNEDDRGEDGDDQGTAQDLGADSLGGLRARGKYSSNHCFLYFEVERKKRAVTIETSWLPDLPAVRDVLGPLGFAREPRGAWRATVPIDDFVGVARRVTRAVELLLTEALRLIE